MIEARGLMVFFENMLALNDFSLACREGAIVGVFGTNGAGKSTLMHALSGLLLDQQRKEEQRGGERIALFGEILFEGEPIEGMKPSDRARRGIVLCPERRRLFAESTVAENLAIGAWRTPKAVARETLDLVYELFPALIPLRRRRAGWLSGGEQQMAAIGRALMAQPRVLLLDEPLLGLAPGVQRDLMAAIPRIRDERGITVVVTEQYAGPVLPCVDEGCIVENGSLVLAGTRAELLANPDLTAAYFGL